MRIEQTQRRHDIGEIVKAGKYDELTRFGIIIIETGATYDCGHYILQQLGVPATDETIATLQSLTGQGNPQPGIALYRETGRQKSPVHFGRYDSYRVISKWNRTGPLLEHSIEDVPPWYGEIVEFRKTDTTTPLLWDVQQMQLFGVDKGY
ncbi:hypothetical protein COV18_05065 [Candidatus Woesearchaeota archaeon CG10_big_fil_rev_8_21_14_0_10_37_12]|nr:MAG: hypothetical protein COV18_05065 [Candidatus Woesearchaeota archaeon CG10_big_fil_rev_8_21_14_0_10_37_12]